jgi:hypothetical protein
MVREGAPMSEKPERQYPLTAIPFPQSVCRGCGHIGCSIPPFCLCRCEAGYTTIDSLAAYQRLVARIPKQQQPRSRSGSMLDRWLDP